MFSCRKPLSRLEHLVMDVVWQRGAAAAEEVREALAQRHPMKESTVRTVLKRLEEKGWLRKIMLRNFERTIGYSSTSRELIEAYLSQ